MSTPATLLRSARTRAGLTQRELAARASTAQSVVARIESGTTSPSWETLERLLAAAGHTIDVELSLAPAADSHMLEDVARIRALSPEARLTEVFNVSRFFAAARRKGSQMAELKPLDPERLFRTLGEHGVRFVLVGALGARMNGFPRMTADADITPARDEANVARLASALRALDAKVFTDSIPEGLAFDVSAPTLARSDLWNLVTVAGRVGVVFTPAGTSGYDELAPRADRFEVYGHELLVARLEDILTSKEAAGRPQDRQDAVVLRQMLGRAK